MSNPEYAKKNILLSEAIVLMIGQGFEGEGEVRN